MAIHLESNTKVYDGQINGHTIAPMLSLQFDYDKPVLNVALDQKEYKYIFKILRAFNIYNYRDKEPVYKLWLHSYYGVEGLPRDTDEATIEFMVRDSFMRLIKAMSEDEVITEVARIIRDSEHYRDSEVQYVREYLQRPNHSI